MFEIKALIEIYAKDIAILLHWLVYYFAALVFLPLSFSLENIFKRFSLAVLFALFSFQLKVEGHFLIYALYGFINGFLMFIPVLIITGFLELNENMRGLNIASFFDSSHQTHSGHIFLAGKLTIFVFLLHGDFFEQLIQNAYRTDFSVSVLTAFEQLTAASLSALSSVFLLSLLPASCFLAVEIVFLFFSKLLPQLSFYSEMLFVKTAIFGIFLYRISL